MMKQTYLSLIALLQSILLLAHGFSADTLVLLAHNEWQQINTLCYRVQKKKIAIASYDTTSALQTTSPAIRGGRSKSNCYIRLDFDEEDHNGIICTPTQEFYCATTRQWISASMLKIGDELLCAHGITKKVTSISLVKEPLIIFTVEVKHTHTFFVTKHSLLTHNMVLPIAFNLGLSIPFGASAGGTAGSFFGPATFVVGAAVGCIVGALVKIACDGKIPTYTIDTYNPNAFEQQVKQQPHTISFSEPQVVVTPDYMVAQQSPEITIINTNTESVFHDTDTAEPLFSITIQNPPKEKPGCGGNAPHIPLICVTPADPMPAFQNPGYIPLSDEERKMFSGGCTLIPIPAQKKEDFIITVDTEDAQKRWAESDKMRELEKRIKELGKTVDTTRPGDWYKNPASNAAGYEWAEKEWASIRASKNDVNKIAVNTGIDVKIIQQIKDHIFHKAHKKRYETASFDPDYDMAKAWVRLEAGNILKADLELLRHELAESLLMGNQEMDYDTAHNIVEKFFSWRNEL